MDAFWIELGFVVSAAVLTLATILAVMIWPPRVVELSLDPPENAHYVQLENEEIKQPILDVQLFYLAWTRNNGRLTERPLWAIVEEWNKQYDRYPQYSDWKISRDQMREIIKRYHNQTAPIPLKTSGRIEWFVVIKDGASRSLQPLADLLGIEPEPEPEPAPDVREDVSDVRGEPKEPALFAPKSDVGVLLLNGATAG